MCLLFSILAQFCDWILLQQNNAPESIREEFEMRLNRLVPFKTNTETSIVCATWATALSSGIP